MNDEHEKEFREQLIETDRASNIDASQLTAKLVAIRQTRRQTSRQNTRLIVTGLAGTFLLMLLAFGIPSANPNEREASLEPDAPTAPLNLPDLGVADITQPALDRTSLAPSFVNQQPVSPSEWARLDLVKATVARLKKQNTHQQLTLVKENLSRSFFDNIDLTDFN